MLIELFGKLLLFPFHLFEEFVSAFLHSPKTKEVEPLELQKLRKKLVETYSLIHQKEEMIELLQGTIEETEYRAKLEIQQREDHWRKIVKDLERQLSETRMQLESALKGI
jgi:hypothetical protein